MAEEHQDNKQKIFLQGMVLSMFCWGLSWTSGKVLARYSDPITISMFRFAITFASMFLIVLATKERFAIERRGWLNLLGAAVSIAIYTWLFFQGLTLGNPGAAAVLVTVLNPILSYIIMLVLQRRMPTRTESIGLGVGITAGLVLLKIWANWQLVFSAGNTYFLLACVSWAVLSLFTSKTAKYGSPTASSFWMYGIAMLLMFILSPPNNSIQLAHSGDVLFWSNLVFSGTITTAFATTFYFVATARIGASKASSFIFMVPVSGALGAWIFLGEVPQWHTILGGILGVGAVYLLNKKSN